MFGRALRRRCPVCGGGPMFRRWLLMVPRCPSCGIRTQRGEDGYTLGALFFNLLLAECITVSLLVATLVRTWPNPPWDTLQWLAPAEAILFPLLVWPFARTLFLAFDLSIRPLEPRDLH